MFCPGRCRSGAVKNPLTPCSLMSILVVLTHRNPLSCYSASALSKRRAVSRITNPGDARASPSYVYRVTPPVGGSSQGGPTSTFISSLKYSPSLLSVHSSLRGGTYAVAGRGLLLGLVGVPSPQLTRSRMASYFSFVCKPALNFFSPHPCLAHQGGDGCR